MTPAGYGHIRASTADRERAADVLKAAFAEGRLDQDEYSERLDRLYAARTYADLAALTYDLPAGPLGTAPPFGPPGGPMIPPYGSAQPYGRMAQRGRAPLSPAERTARRTSDLALVSLLLGAGAFVTAGVTSIPAIILAVVALVRIARSGGNGTGLAIAGIVLALAAVLIL